MLSDKTGDSISSKNPSFCELTAHYWVWKNVKADFYGFFHYRRLLDFSSQNHLKIFHKLSPRIFQKYCWDPKIIAQFCKTADIILPLLKKDKKNLSLYEYYKKEHHIKDLDITLKVLKEKYPDMAQAADDVINGTKGYFANIFIMRQNYFKDYEKWLFDILFEVEKQIDISNYTPYQRRVFGFLAERLESIYIEYLKRTTQARIVELPLVFWEENAKKYYQQKFKFFKRRFFRLIGLYHD